MLQNTTEYELESFLTGTPVFSFKLKVAAQSVFKNLR